MIISVWLWEDGRLHSIDLVEDLERHHKRFEKIYEDKNRYYYENIRLGDNYELKVIPNENPI